MTDNFMLILGEGEKPGMRWLIARKYGYLSLVGSKYWESLQELTPGDRVFPYMNVVGFVGAARVTGEMIAARDAEVPVDGRLQPLLDQLTPEWQKKAASDNLEETVKVVPVKWLVPLRSLDRAVKVLSKKGNTYHPQKARAVKICDQIALRDLESAFGLQSPGRPQ